MPTHKSAVKRVRQSKKRNLRNRMARSRLRTSIVNVLSAKTQKEALPLLRDAYSIIDKSAKTGIIHRNNAANKKSKLSLAIAKLPA